MSKTIAGLDPVPASVAHFSQIKSQWDRRSWQVLVYHFFGKKTFDLFRQKNYLTRGGYAVELHPFLQKAWRAFVKVCAHPSNSVITKALNHVSLPYNAEALTRKIANTFDSVILPTGWHKHAMTAVFWDEYLILCNRGYRPKESYKYVTYYRVDRSKITVKLVEQIMQGPVLAMKTQDEFLYETLPKVLDATRDRFCRRLERMQPSRQKNNNCVIANLKQAVRVLLLCLGSKDNIEEHQNHYKSFAIFSRNFIHNLYEKRNRTTDQKIGL